MCMASAPEASAYAPIDQPGAVLFLHLHRSVRTYMPACPSTVHCSNANLRDVRRTVCISVTGLDYAFFAYVLLVRMPASLRCEIVTR